MYSSLSAEFEGDGDLAILDLLLELPLLYIFILLYKNLTVFS